MKFKTPKGTRDFLPDEMAIREYVLQTIKRIFESYGFECIETPAFEDLELLTAKSGDVAKQIFRIETEKERKLGLRFDLTVPLARFLANNPQIPKPFKRYAIAPVWRYEEPQAGRMRQFYQADIDICGSKGMEADVECIACAVDCLETLGFKSLKVRINNRKVLEGFVEIIKKKIPARIEFGSLEVFRAIDKIGKIGADSVKKELEKIGLPRKQIKDLLGMVSIKGRFEEVLEKGKELLGNIAKEGIEELEQIYEFSKFYGISGLLVLDFSLARGLDYYTGPIFEIEAETKRKVGSLAGGGRYDSLVELLGGRATPATGISLGIERIVEIMKEEMELPKTKIKAFIANVDEKVKPQAIKIAQRLRKDGISCQTDVMNRSLTKQLEFADGLGIPFVVIVGEKELKSKKFKLKDMKKNVEKELSLEQIINILKESKQK
ncbi:MAG: histidine--tRNA ligase [Candidatus Aenigmarchaeota archaeon]|nr:histidine--tRNA ligase [Candidatus Aenigmarchaeota archaeon]